MNVVAVVGMKREAKIVASPHVRVGIGRDFQNRIDETTCGIISIGIAGALSPSLQVGDCIVANDVIATKRFTANDAWSRRMKNLLPRAKSGTILYTFKPIASAAEKRALGASNRADAVDMESGPAVWAAARLRIPFAVLRVISDDIGHDLPPATLVALKPNGSIALGRVMASVLRNPLQLPALIRTGRESEKAFAALLRCVEVLGPGLGCPYLG